MRDDSSRVTEAQKQKPEITKLNKLYRVLISLLDIYIYSIESSIYFGPMVELVSLCIMSLCSVHFISALIIIITTFYFPLLLVGIIYMFLCWVCKAFALLFHHSFLVEPCAPQYPFSAASAFRFNICSSLFLLSLEIGIKINTRNPNYIPSNLGLRGFCMLCSCSSRLVLSFLLLSLGLF